MILTDLRCIGGIRRWRCQQSAMDNEKLMKQVSAIVVLFVLVCVAGFAPMHSDNLMPVSPVASKHVMPTIMLAKVSVGDAGMTCCSGAEATIEPGTPPCAIDCHVLANTTSLIVKGNPASHDRAVSAELSAIFVRLQLPPPRHS